MCAAQGQGLTSHPTEGVLLRWLPLPQGSTDLHQDRTLSHIRLLIRWPELIRGPMTGWHSTLERSCGSLRINEPLASFTHAEELHGDFWPTENPSIRLIILILDVDMCNSLVVFSPLGFSRMFLTFLTRWLTNTQAIYYRTWGSEVAQTRFKSSRALSYNVYRRREKKGWFPSHPPPSTHCLLLTILHDCLVYGMMVKKGNSDSRCAR